MLPADSVLCLREFFPRLYAQNCNDCCRSSQCKPQDKQRAPAVVGFQYCAGAHIQQPAADLCNGVQQAANRSRFAVF